MLTQHPMTSKSARMTDAETSDWVLVPRDMPQDYLEFYEGVMMDEGRKGPGAAKKAWAALLKLVAATKPLSASPKGDDLEPVAWQGNPTPAEAAFQLREYASKQRRLHGTCPPGDNTFEDAASVIDRLASALQSLKAERDAETKRADSNFANIATIQRHLDEATIRAEAAEAENATLKREIAELREALTPSGDTKAAYIGEFSFTVDFTNEDGEDTYMRVDVPWTTVKEIMAAILDRATQGAAALEAKP